MPPQTKIVHPSFNIHSGSSAADQHLFVHAGAGSISLLTLDAATKSVNDIVCYYFDASADEERIAENYKEVFAEEALLKQSFRKTDLVYTFPESILTPHEVYSSINADDMLQAVYGDLHPGAVKTDFMYRYNLHNVYRVPAMVNSFLQQQLPFANFTHQFSLFPDTRKEDGLFVCFYPNSFVALLREAGNIKAVRSFNYASPDDAAYHLLALCQSFGPASYDTTLLLSGTIDPDSALYQELHKYFLNIAFASLPDEFSYPQQVNDHPLHYFSHLVSISACV